MAIEKKMAQLAALDEPVVASRLAARRSRGLFQGTGRALQGRNHCQHPSNEDVSLYREGKFEDLCRGPHVPSTGKLKHFKLMKVAGAYWRGDHRNEMLQRIYGTAWATKDELQQHLTMLEEAEKRDHRKLGRELDLFHIDEHSPGTVFWHPKGWTLWQGVEQYMRKVYQDNGYLEVKGPQIIDKRLWEKTGHWDKYRENMFITESEKRDYALKPMNCPGHILIYKQGIKSYRDLPLRFGEFGAVPPQRAFGRFARHHARARLHPRRWPHFLHRRPDLPAEVVHSLHCCKRSTRTLASPTSSTSCPRVPKSPHRYRRKLGPCGEGSCRGLARIGLRLRVLCRVRVRFTAPRSNTP